MSQTQQTLFGRLDDYMNEKQRLESHVMFRDALEWLCNTIEAEYVKKADAQPHPERPTTEQLTPFIYGNASRGDK